jgi:flavodoxin/ferredoxin
MQNLKTMIVYYSFSGNTRKIAQAISQGMSQVAGKSDIAAIEGSSGVPGMKPQDLLEYDLIGFGSPAWSHSITPNMMAFIESLPSLKGKHTFFFVVHGILPGGAVRWMVKALKAKRSTVIGWEDWYGSGFPANIFKPYHTDGHPDEIDLNEATNFGREMVERSRRISEGEKNLIPVLPSREEYERRYGRKPVYKATPKRKDYKVRPVWLSYEIKINRERCNKCNLCVENCPMGCIDLSATPPIDKAACVACWVCEQICPLGAVEIDYDTIIRERESSAGKKWEKAKYLQENVERIDKDPRFRRLVPHEDLGKDGYWYQISKHPRIIIPQK